MSETFIFDMLASGQKLASYTPRVDFTLDLESAASAIPQLELEVLRFVFRTLLVEYPHEFLVVLAASRQTCQALWKFFFSGTGQNIPPVPPGVQGGDLEHWREYRICPASNICGYFVSKYARWFYILLTNAGGDKPYRFDRSDMRYIYAMDDLFSFRLIVEAGIFEAFENELGLHHKVDGSQLSLWPPQKFPTQCMRYLQADGYKQYHAIPRAFTSLVLPEVSLKQSCVDIADGFLYNSLLGQTPLDIMHNPDFLVTPRIFEYIPKKDLRKMLTFKRPGGGPNLYSTLDFELCHQWQNHLTLLANTETRARVADHVLGLYDLVGMKPLIIVELMIRMFNLTGLKIASDALRTEPLWPTDFCKRWLEIRRDVMGSSEIRICFFILFCLGHGVWTMSVAWTSMGPLKREIRTLTIELLNRTRKREFSRQWVRSLTADNALETHRGKLMELASTTKFTADKRKSTGPKSKAKRKK
jgi:hypothetical protein